MAHTMQNKRKEWNRFYFNDQWIEEHIAKADSFDFSKIDSLVLFNEPQPQVMMERIKNKNWKFDHDLSKNKYSIKEKVKRLISRLIGYRIGEYKNYKIV